MEDKIKREAKTFLEKLFKKHDKRGAGAISVQELLLIVKTTVEDYNPETETEEFDELVKQHVKDTKYTEHNKKTNSFDVKYQKDTLDFPSTLAIVVHFLKKREKGANAYAGKQFIRFHDLPDSHKNILGDQSVSQKRRLF